MSKQATLLTNKKGTVLNFKSEGAEESVTLKNVNHFKFNREFNNDHFKPDFLPAQIVGNKLELIPDQENLIVMDEESLILEVGLVAKREELIKIKDLLDSEQDYTLVLSYTDLTLVVKINSDSELEFVESFSDIKKVFC